MRLTESLRWLLRGSLAATLAGVALPGVAAVSGLSDLVARIEYGYYANEPDVLVAAAAGLERLPERDPDVRYHRALAAFRLALLGGQVVPDVGAQLDACLDLAEPRDVKGAAAAEGWTLVAACADLAARREPLRGVLLQRRRDQAIAQARTLDAGNPRLKLLDAWLAGPVDADANTERRAAVVASLEATVAAFAQRAGRPGPTWGEAEALVLLAEIRLDSGERRVARDLVEQALLVAPGFGQALELRVRVQAEP